MTKLLRKTRTLVDLALAWVLFACSHAFPRSRRIWVFVGWHRLGQREFLADKADRLPIPESDSTFANALSQLACETSYDREYIGDILSDYDRGISHRR